MLRKASPLTLCGVGEFFLNKVWNALLCFIICSLILLLCTFTNIAKRRKRARVGEVHGHSGNTYIRDRSSEKTENEL